MRIAVVDPPAYTPPYDHALCAALARAGHDVTLYTTRFAHGEAPEPSGYDRVECFYQRDVPLLPRRIARGLQHPRDLHRLLRRLVRERPDVVHVQWSVINRVDVPAYRRLGLPVVLTVHDPAGQPGRGVDRDEIRAFDAVVAHSRFGVERIRERAGDDVDVWHVPHGALELVDQRDIGPSSLAPAGAGPVVTLAGLLRTYKGVDVLLEAWPRVREAVPEARLVIAGRQMDAALPDPPPPGVTIHPEFLDDGEFASLLAASDLVALPYRDIDLSGVLFAALQLGRPLVLSDIGGFSELAGQGAELVPPGDPSALAAKIIDLLGDPNRRAQLSEQARTAAREVYSWDAIAARYTERYEALLAHHPPTP